MKNTYIILIFITLLAGCKSTNNSGFYIGEYKSFYEVSEAKELDKFIKNKVYQSNEESQAIDSNNSNEVSFIDDIVMPVDYDSFQLEKLKAAITIRNDSLFQLGINLVSSKLNKGKVNLTEYQNDYVFKENELILTLNSEPISSRYNYSKIQFNKPFKKTTFSDEKISNNIWVLNFEGHGTISIVFLYEIESGPFKGMYQALIKDNYNRSSELIGLEIAKVFSFKDIQVLNYGNINNVGIFFMNDEKEKVKLYGKHYFPDLEYNVQEKIVTPILSLTPIPDNDELKILTETLVGNYEATNIYNEFMQETDWITSIDHLELNADNTFIYSKSISRNKENIATQDILGKWKIDKSGWALKLEFEQVIDNETVVINRILPINDGEVIQKSMKYDFNQIEETSGGLLYGTELNSLRKQ